MLKKVFYPLIAAIILGMVVAIPVIAQNSNISSSTFKSGKVLVEGNGFTVTQSELDDAYIRYTMSLAAEGKRVPTELSKKLEAEMLEQLILKKIILQKVSDQDIAEGKKRAKAELEKLLKQVGNEDKLRRKSITEGWKSYNDFLKNLDEVFVCNVFLENYVKVNISKDDAYKYYKENQKLFDADEMFMGGFILFSKKDPLTEAELTVEQWEAKKQLAAKVLKEIKDGTDFDTEMKKFSDDIYTRGRGATIVFLHGQMGEEFDKTAFALRSGDISNLVETPNGIYIIKSVKHTDKGLIPFDEIKDKLIDQLSNEQRRKELKESAEVLKKEYNVIYLNKK